MKNFQLFVITATLSSGAAFAHPLPAGSYAGSGSWSSPSARGSYRVETNLGPEEIEASYLFDDGRQLRWQFRLLPESNGHFELRTASGEKGSAYCLAHTPLCHYEVESSGIRIEETLTVQGGKLYRFGSKSGNELRIFWQEAQERK